MIVISASLKRVFSTAPTFACYLIASLPALAEGAEPGMADMRQADRYAALAARAVAF